MSDTAPYNTSEIDEAVTRLMETREKFLYTLYEQRIAAAVAAEREACAKVADRWAQNTQQEADRMGQDIVSSYVRHEASAYRRIAAAIRARAGEGEQVPMSDNASCET